MAAQRLTFSEWLPDQPSVLNTIQDITNLIPLPNGYYPFPNAVNYSNAASSTLNSAFAGKFNNTIKIFSGSSDKLYLYNTSTQNLDNISKTGGYSSVFPWKFTQYGNAVIAANNADKLQVYYLNAASNFADLASTAPVAKYVTIVRDFVVAAHLNGGTNANKIQWSNINDETNWTPSATSQSDSQVIAEGGNIVGITGGQIGIILLEKAIYRMSYIGSPLFFQFDAISRGLGCIEGNSIADYAGLTYFLSNDGFYMCDGQSTTPIGVEKVDRWFYDYADLTKLNTMSAAVDPFKKIVIWNFANKLGGRTLLVYNYVLKKWSKIETDVNYIAPIITTGVSLEALDAYGNMDTLTTSLDDPLWAGGKYLFAGVRGTRLITFSGSNMSASITIGDWETGYNGVITLARPQVENGSANVSVASRKNLADNIMFGSVSVADANGRCSLRSAGRYHQIKIIPTGSWLSMVSIDVDVINQGIR